MLASVVICADVLAARIGIDLAAAIRKQFEPSGPLSPARPS
jgi:hypothetical protein